MQQAQQAQQNQPSQQQPLQEAQSGRTYIWSGIMEWAEKIGKTPTPNQPKTTKQVPCQVSVASKDLSGL